MPIKHGTHTYLTCMNILSQFYFLTPMDYNPPWTIIHGPKGKFGKI